MGVVSEKYCRENGEDYGQKDTLVVGTGPFSLSNWGSDQITLVKNNKYKGTPPRSKSLQFIVTREPAGDKATAADGKIDILTGVTPQFANTICEEGKER